MLVMLILFAIILIGFGWYSQRFAATPPILDAAGQPVIDSIASLETIQLGETNQWITLRGTNVNNPVLLYLAGGPGSSDLAWTRKYLKALENHFVVVNWDQPGSAKSYGAVSHSMLTPARYISDAFELVEHLRKRFKQEKIYLLGHSWGSLLGIWLVQQHPEYFHAYIGCGQMVNTIENDVAGYEFALRYLEEKGNVKALANLRKKGLPPYRDANLVTSYAAYGRILLEYMNANAPAESGKGRPNLTADMILAPEYGWLDKVNFVRGALTTFPAVYPQIEQVDLQTQVPRLEVPIYFMLGRWDMNVVASLAERYFHALEAPFKKLVWFEHSGHLPHYEEPQTFTKVMVEQVLEQTNI